jgi:hypothetical protein
MLPPFWRKNPPQNSSMLGRATGCAVTVTVAVHVPLPPLPKAVIVYVVVVNGNTDTVPPAVGVTVPTPLLMLTEVAFELVHVRIEVLPPAWMEAGAATSVQVAVVAGL